jgi:DNA-directed RNA polymerase specialized sigma24 family protein
MLMTHSESLTFWLQQFKAGDAAAAQPLWEEYFRRLVGLARARLQGTPTAASGPEDVALSAFASFCRGVELGRFPRLDDRDDLWQVLVMLTARKAIDVRQREMAKKRGSGRVQHVSALPGGDQEADVLDNLIGREPAPQFAFQVAEECRRLLGLLRDDQLRTIALRKMEGYTNEEIAAGIRRSVGTVERKLQLIRQAWEEEQPG